MPLRLLPYLLLSVALFASGCGKSSEDSSPSDTSKPAESTASSQQTVPNEDAILQALQGPPQRDPSEGYEFVGGQSCKACHEEAFSDWTKSHHHAAMAEATPETVLADFEDVEFEHFGHKTRFFRKGDEFWVNAEDADGTRKDFKVEYTFGVEPLQQYLIPFPGGRLQALNICWDTRPEEEGGQRWFHLYPEEAIPPDDDLHWTRRHFNWNRMCADCHSTNLDKNFDLATNSYDTQWTDIQVSCEACHGPGSQHLEWAAEWKEGDPYGDMGLLVKLKQDDPGTWMIDEETGQPKRSKPLEHQNQLTTCAPCHAHRQLLQTEYYHGQDFLDTHVPSVLDRVHYHADGQIKEEVYVYGSFIQSKMYHSNVRCTDCHHHHTMELYAQNNSLCIRCHQPDQYDTPAHHFHEVGSTGASCIECHMPPKYYMVVDKRRDHSIRIPRPDLSVKYGTPNACTVCHTEEGQDNKWAAEAFVKWWGEKQRPSYGESLAKGRRDPQFWQKELIRLAEDETQPGLARATALDYMAEAPTQASMQTVVARLQDPDPLVRRHAVAGLEPLPAQQRAQIAAPALRDPVRAVRVEAARLLADARANLSEADRPMLDSGIAEYVEMQMAVADVPEAHMSLAILYTSMGQSAKAEEEYLTAIRLDPRSAPARVNLADLYFRIEQLDKAEPMLKEGLEVRPNDALLHEALGLFYVRKRDYEKALESMRTAAELEPETARLQYTLGVALNSLGRFQEALPHLEKAQRLEPENEQYILGLATVCRDAGEFELAITYFDKAYRLTNNPNFLFELAGLSFRAKDFAQAERYVTELERMAPNDPRVGQMRQQLLMLRGQ